MYKLMSIAFLVICFQANLFSQKDSKTLDIVSINPCIDSCCNLLKADGTLDLENQISCNIRTIEQTIAINLRYPVSARNANIEGLVIVSFQVTSIGQGENFTILKDIGGGCGREAIRLAKLLFTEHQWQYPYDENSENLPITYNLPIRFRL